MDLGSTTPAGFSVVAREPGQSGIGLPTWTNSDAPGIRFDSPVNAPSRIDLPGIPGGFHITDVLTADECEQFVSVTEALGYHADSPVSLGHDVRHNHNVNWVVGEDIDGTIWNRFRHLVTESVGGRQAVGLNARFRFYRYEPGDFFKPHTDGAWPGSRVVDGTLQHDAYGDRLSQMTCLLFLSEAYRGGRTLFYVADGEGSPAGQSGYRTVAVETPRGHALCFPHGYQPSHCLHAGEAVEAGVKYIIRTDVLFPLPTPM